MRHVTLLPLDLQYVDIIFTLSSDPHVKNVLGIKVETIEARKLFFFSQWKKDEKITLYQE